MDERWELNHNQPIKFGSVTKRYVKHKCVKTSLGREGLVS